MTSLMVAAVQMVSGSVLEENLEQASSLIQKAAEQGARLIVLPENFAMFSASQFRELAEQENSSGLVSSFLSGQAKLYGAYIVAGSVPVCAPDGRVFSSSLVYAPDGVQIKRYDKIHLFDVEVDDNVGSYRESKHIKAGNTPSWFSIDERGIGLSICYDLRFPELYRYLAANGCQIFVVPAAFTYTTGEKHWEILLRARAIENQCFIVAPNQGGEHLTRSGDKRKTWGRSSIIDYEGQVMSRLELGPGVLVEKLDFNKQEVYRKNMPVLEHRRL